MKRLIVNAGMLIAVSLAGGCATGIVYTTPKTAPHGYAEFYVVPTYDETVVFKDAFRISVATNRLAREPKVLGTAQGAIIDGTRLRIAVTPGRHEFLLRPRSVQKDAQEQKWVPVEVTIEENKVTPVCAGIRVHETDSMGKRAAVRLLAGPAMGHAMMTGASYDMRVDVARPQPFYECCASSRGFNGVVVTVEGRDEAQVKAMREWVARTREGLDLRQKDGLAAFRARYEKDRMQAVLKGGLIRIAAMAPGLSFTWNSLILDQWSETAP